MNSQKYSVLLPQENFPGTGTVTKDLELESQTFVLGTVRVDDRAKKDLSFLCQQSIEDGLTALMVPHGLSLQSIFFDMDATVIQQESIVELAKAAGVERQVDDITEKAMAGEMDFTEALEERVKLLAGLPESIFSQTLPSLTLQPGMEQLALWAKDRVSCFVVSGGFQPLASPIVERLSFKEAFANHLEIEDGALTGRTTGTIVDGTAKEEFVRQKMSSNGWTTAEVMVVGDGANDQKMMGLAGIGIGFRPKKALVPFLDGAIYQGGHELISLVLDHAKG